MGAQLNFEIKAKLDQIVEFDVSYYSIIRTPISKTSSFSILRCFYSQKGYDEIIRKLEGGSFPDAEISIYSTDESAPYDKKIGCIFKSNQKIISAKSVGPTNYEMPKIYVEFVLVHDILIELEYSNVYNTILENTTAFDAIKEYENWVDDNYGNIFSRKYLAQDINRYKYEQLLIKARNDLNVPNYIINTYKPTFNFSYYFYDTFYLDSSTDKEITTHLLNYSDENQFTQKDISDYRDMNFPFAVFLGSFPFQDRQHNIKSKDANRINLEDRNIAFKHQKDKFNAFMNQCSSPEPVDNFNIDVDNKRKIKPSIAGPRNQKSYSKTKTYTNIYCPDNTLSGEQRFQEAQNLYEKINSFNYFEFNNVYPDMPQFGHKYNLDDYESKEYKFTPLSICNIFFRKNNKEPFLSHMAKTVMLRWY